VGRLLALDGSPDEHEGFGWQLESTRRYLQELSATEPEVAHLCGVLDAVTVESPRPHAPLRMSLTAYAYFLEHEGRFEEALEVLALAGRTHGEAVPAREFSALALFTGRLNRLIARWDRANAAYLAAEESGRTSADVEAILRSRLGRAAVLRGQGNLPASRERVEAVLEEVADGSHEHIRGDAFLDLGAVLHRQGLRAEALQATYRAFLHTLDPLQQMRILGDVGTGLAELGEYTVARLALEIVLKSEASFLIRANALVEMMGVESALGNRVSFERRRQEAATLAGRMPPSMSIDYRFKEGVGLTRFGQLARGRALLVEAHELAEEHALNEWYFKIDRVLASLDNCRPVELEPAAPADEAYAPVIAEMAIGLREYSLAAGV
jgi:tetratricopeptide (TPR) repeat protein